MSTYHARLAVLGAGLLLLSAWWWVFGAFFPTEGGTLGNDYARILPLLLAGTYWQLANGWLALPWYTPAFCGGIPLFPHPGAIYPSLPQLLAFWIDPLSAVANSVLAFAALSLYGAYRLLRRSFGFERAPALLGAGLFLFNGFYAHRMLAGHLEFQGFALLPLLAAGLLGRPGPPRGWRRAAPAVLGAAAGFAYLLLSGMGQLLPPVAIALAATWLLCALCVEGCRPAVFPGRLLAAGGVALAVAASKVVAMASFLTQFPRDFFEASQLESAGSSPWHALATLALGGWAVDVPAFERHEHEYAVTPLPFLLIPLGLVLALRSGRPVPRRGLWAAAGLGVLLALPLVLTLGGELWRPLLRGVPGLRSLGLYQRWYLAYALPLAVGAAWAVQQLPAPRLRAAAALLALVAAVGFEAGVDRRAYREQLYPPGPVVQAAAEALERGAPVPVREIAARVADGEVKLDLNRNDVLIDGRSQLACYDPIFGYRLEAFPRGALRPGPALASRAGSLNLKNPACMVFPRENGCRPGDPFRAEQLDDARRFAAYRPFRWRRSAAQRAADALSRVALAACLGASLWLALTALRQRLSPGGR